VIHNAITQSFVRNRLDSDVLIAVPAGHGLPCMTNAPAGFLTCINHKPAHLEVSGPDWAPRSNAAFASASASGPAPRWAACHCPSAAKALDNPRGGVPCCTAPWHCWLADTSCSAACKAGSQLAAHITLRWLPAQLPGVVSQHDQHHKPGRT